MLLLCLRHVCNGIGCRYDDHINQLSNSPPSPELSSGDGAPFRKIGASLTEECAHFGFGLTQPWENQKDAHLKMKHDGAFVLELAEMTLPAAVRVVRPPPGVRDPTFLRPAALPPGQAGACHSKHSRDCHRSRWQRDAFAVSCCVFLCFNT